MPVAKVAVQDTEKLTFFFFFYFTNKTTNIADCKCDTVVRSEGLQYNKGHPLLNKIFKVTKYNGSILNSLSLLVDDD